MASLLSAYISAAGRRGFIWGEHDCIVFGANWVEHLTGRDPIAAYRGRYATEEEARALLEAAGGAAMAINEELSANGWTFVQGEELKAGDVALALVPGHKEAVVSIAVSRSKLAFLTARGILIWPGDVIAAWRWNDPHG